jgi:hypothetical protein
MQVHGCNTAHTPSASRRLNWSEPFSVSQSMTGFTKGTSRLNQRLGGICVCVGGEGGGCRAGKVKGVEGAGGWVPDPPGHVRPGYALENEARLAGEGGGGLAICHDLR